MHVSAEEMNEKSEQNFFFEITVYENDVERQKFDKIINEFSDIWKDARFINVSKEQWMRLSLKKDWQNKMISKIKIYSSNTKNRKIINDTFNRLQI